jgi:hypothetical protein
MRCCAINESDASEQKEWLAVWLDEGLSCYKAILEEGIKLCQQKTLIEEAALWQNWVSGLTTVQERSSTPDWSMRKAAWSRVIKKAQ